MCLKSQNKITFAFSKLKPLLAKPLCLDDTDKYRDILNAKKNLRNSMKDSFYYVENVRSEKADFNASIERYSDRYSKLKIADINKWKPG